MEHDPISASGAINLGAEAYFAGHRDEARRLFAWALLKESDKELGWLWFATVTANLAEQRYCLQRAIRLNPESAGLLRIALLPTGVSTIPPDLIQLDTPPLPPGFAGPQGVMPLLPRTTIERRHRARHVRAGGVLPGETPDDVPADGEVAPVEAPVTPPPGRRATPLVWVAIGLAIVIGLVGGWWLWQEQQPTAGAAFVIAYAGPLSGPEGAIGTEELNAVELAAAQANAAGGIDGHPITVLGFDDQNDPERAAAVAEEIVANDAVNLVIGHHQSDSSLAAAPIYAAAGLPAITSAATADALTVDYPTFFRVVMSNTQQGKYLALYASQLLGQTRTSVITTDGTYESTLGAAFATAFAEIGTVVGEWTLDPADREASAAAIAEAIDATGNPGIVFLALQTEDAHAMLLALRRAGVAGYVLGGDAIGYEGFLEAFANDPEQMALPGAITDFTYVSSPLIYDSVGGASLDFIDRYYDAHGVNPAWFGAKAYDATTMAIAALGALDSPDAPVADRRAATLAALNSMRQESDSVAGLTGPLYFDRTNAVPQVYSIGLFDKSSLLSAPDQYRVVTDLESFNVLGRNQVNRVFDLGGVILRPYRVAYVGVDLNQISNLNPVAQTYDADFYLWLRYTGDADVENVFFPNAEDPELRLDDPVERTVVAGQQFVMYRVNETFAQPLDFHDYPWDAHVLTIDLQNLLLTDDDLMYVPDRSNIRETQAQRLVSGTDSSQPFNQIPSWIVTRVFFAQESALVRASTPSEITGDPDYVTASKYVASVFYERDVRSFLIKNLLPLAVLALVTYISLFFPPENASTRIGFSITAILTSSVLLQSVSSNLPDIGYTVAIEWGYYAYLAMSAVLVLGNIMVDRWYKGKRFVAVQQLDRILRTAYPIIILLAVGAYAVHFW